MFIMSAELNCQDIFTNWFWFCNVDLITVIAVVAQVGNAVAGPLV